jgi:ketosteroid isomerase-like protein
MSQENVEVVQRGVASLREGRIEEWFDLLDPEFEWDLTRTNPDGQVYRGYAGAREVMEGWLGTWDEYDVDIEDVLEAEDDRVVMVLRERGRMKASSAWAEQVRGTVFTLRRGKVVHAVEYQDRSSALEAAGLRE